MGSNVDPDVAELDDVTYRLMMKRLPTPKYKRTTLKNPKRCFVLTFSLLLKLQGCTCNIASKYLQLSADRLDRCARENDCADTCVREKVHMTDISTLLTTEILNVPQTNQ
ncbi:hypothetical protein CSKR_106881 [Clonorchis sinensis]|uniref:Uncharacterized protein n=2 Tax=Clonorchis sinensis TaxID=79923 RepID=G7Y9D3_CLOSI|nr:hypothetical protein CSKR_106881 [Clonorchis sinensis]GAA49568.1 hypothetical protein CLF_103237 [Clonorchis sinensis]